MIGRVRAALIASGLAVALLVPSAPAGAALPLSASLSVLHVADGVEAAQVVDVYAGSMRIMDDLRPGELRAVRITRGQYTVQVFPDGQDPQSSAPLTTIAGLRLTEQANVTVAIHRAPDGSVTATDFTNNTLRNPPAQGRVTIRHVALAPALDIQLGDARTVRSLTNSDEIILRGLRGDQLTEVLQSDSAAVLLTQRRIPIARPVNTVVYIWGSAPDGLRMALQPIPVGTAR